MTARPRRRVLLLVAGLLAAVLLPVTSAQSAPLDLGYRDHSYGSSVTAPTGAKPQSKLWHTDGSWWGVLWSTGRKTFEIHRFDLANQATSAWSSTGVAVDVRRNSQSDVLWDPVQRKLYVLTHLKDTDTATTDRGLRFLRFGYAAGTYTHELTKTVASRNVEAAVLDKDGTGRLWATWTEPNGLGGRTVTVAHSTTDDSTWVPPFALPVGGAAETSDDDISTVVAYGTASGRRTGVLWSNARTASLYFASHVDGAPADAWSLTTLCSTTLCPDDHLNIKSVDGDAAGNLYAVVKTSLDDKGSPDPADPLMVVYRLDPAGSWSSAVAWTVGDDVTRAIVVLDAENRRAHLFAAGPCCSGGTVFTKHASFDDLRFPSGLGTPFMRSERLAEGEAINNPTSTKQTVGASTGLLVLAGIDRTREYVHRHLPLPHSTSSSPSASPSPSPSPSPSAAVPTNLGEVGRASATKAGNTLVLTTTTDVPAGARLVVGAGYSGVAGVTARASDDAGGTWSRLVHRDNGTSTGSTSVVLSRVVGPSGLAAGTRITLRLSSSVTYRIAVGHAFSGAGTVAATSFGSASSTTPSVAPVSALAGDVLYSVKVWNSGTVSHQPSAGVTELAELTAGTKRLAISQYAVGSAGAVSDPGTLTAAVVWTDSAVLLRG